MVPVSRARAVRRFGSMYLRDFATHDRACIFVCIRTTPHRRPAVDRVNSPHAFAVDAR
jgi:hypothetical protein